MSKKPAPQSGLSFEKAIEKLEGIVDELETGSLSLDKSLTNFEDGMKLAKECDDMLNEATGRVEKIVKEFSGEKITALNEDEFDTTTGEDDDDI